jgi:hypothetical protein
MFFLLIFQIEEQVEAKKISIKLPDGKNIDGIAGKTTPYDVAVGIKKSLGEIAVVAKVICFFYF